MKFLPKNPCPIYKKDPFIKTHCVKTFQQSIQKALIATKTPTEMKLCMEEKHYSSLML